MADVQEVKRKQQVCPECGHETIRWEGNQVFEVREYCFQGDPYDHFIEEGWEEQGPWKGNCLECGHSFWDDGVDRSVILHTDKLLFEDLCEILGFHDAISESLVDLAWHHFHKGLADQEKWDEYNEWAGERYLTEIYLIGNTVHTVIFDTESDQDSAERQKG